MGIQGVAKHVSTSIVRHALGLGRVIACNMCCLLLSPGMQEYCFVRTAKKRICDPPIRVGGDLVAEETCLGKFSMPNSGTARQQCFKENVGGPQQKIPKRNGQKIKSKARGLLIGELRPGSAAGRNQ